MEAFNNPQNLTAGGKVGALWTFHMESFSMCG